jgi:hypothetical protein
LREMTAVACQCRRCNRLVCRQFTGGMAWRAWQPQYDVGLEAKDRFSTPVGREMTVQPGRPPLRRLATVPGSGDRPQDGGGAARHTGCVASRGHSAPGAARPVGAGDLSRPWQRRPRQGRARDAQAHLCRAGGRAQDLCGGDSGECREASCWWLELEGSGGLDVKSPLHPGNPHSALTTCPIPRSRRSWVCRRRKRGRSPGGTAVRR